MRWWARANSAPSHQPRVKPGDRVYAIGDIHGRADLLDKLLTQIQRHADQSPQAEKTLVFLGDYVDRGKYSKGVIDRLLKIQLPDWKVVFLRGNHDQAVLDFLADPSIYRAWKYFGAAETLLSYGVTPPLFERDAEFAKAREELAAKTPPEHIEFLQKLELSYTHDDYYFCHAGVRPGVPLEAQVAEDLLWIRDEFLNYHRAFEKVVVHGHTPMVKPVKTMFRIGIDTGAHATNCLTAAILEDKNCSFLKTTSKPAPLTAEAYV